MDSYYYFSVYCLLRQTTNRIYDVRMSDNIAKKTGKICFVFPYIHLSENIKFSEIKRIYRIENNVSFKMLPTPIFVGKFTAPAKAIMGFVILSYFLFKLLFLKKGNRVILFFRDSNLILPLLSVQKRLFKNKKIISICFMHEYVERRKKLYQQCDYLVTTNQSISSAVTANMEVKKEKLFTLGPVVPDDFLKNMPLKIDARRKIGFENLEKPLVVYTGKIYKNQREIDLILQAAKKLPEVLFVFTGGKAEAVKQFQDKCRNENIPNAIFTGFLEMVEDLRSYQCAADVLVSYYTSDDHMVEFNFPLKLVEYLCAGAPIVTPNFKATMDVLNESNAMFVEPENPESLAAGIARVIKDKALADSLVKNALATAKKMSFSSKVTELLNFIK